MNKIYYKLTDEINGRYFTKNDTEWGENVEHKTNGKGEICGKGWLHCYESPEIAGLFYKIHVDFKNPVLWTCECSGKFIYNYDKIGCTKIKTIKKIKLPEFTLKQFVKFSILCAMKVYGGKEWNDWAKNYLNNAYSTTNSAIYAANAAQEADAAASAHYATYAAAIAAHYATYAAIAAHYAAAIAAHSDVTSYVARYATHAAISAVSACREDYMNLTDIIKEL